MPSRFRRLVFASLLAAALGWRLVPPGNQREEAAVVGLVPAAKAPAPPRAGTVERDPLAAFAAWLRLSPRDPHLGEQLARARQPVFQRLMAADPEAALGRALTAEERATLPPEVAAHVESHVAGIGRFDVVAACALPGHPGHRHATHRSLQLGDRRYTVHAYGRALAFPSQEAFAASGIALGDELALAEPPAAAQPAISVSWTHGEKTVLWIRAEFPDDPGSPVSDAAIQQTMAEVAAFYADVSRGRCTLRTVILPGTVRVSATKASLASSGSSNAVEQQALALARAYDAAQGNTGAYHPDRVDRVIVIAKASNALSYGGLGGIGRSGIYLNGTFSPAVVAHELGHNHGLLHAHAWAPSGASPTGPGTHLEYGDPFDIMGFMAGTPFAHFNAKSKADLAYFDATHIHPVEAAGTYRIYRHDHRQAEGQQAIKVELGDYDFWVEHRRLQNNYWAQHAARFQNGIQIRWGRYPPRLGSGTYLLDGRPATGNDQTDAPVALGETFTDLATGVSFTPVAAGGTSPREWIDVRVDFGALPGSGNRDPALVVSLPGATVPARSELLFRAVVSDPDGDATRVQWDFGDGSEAQSGSTVAHRFAVGGPRRIRCTVTDGRGGLARYSAMITVQDPLQAWSPLAAFAGPQYLTHNGRELLAVGAAVHASSDGISWTRRAALPNHAPSAAVSGGGRTVTVGTRLDNPALGSIHTSPEGAAWQAALITPPPPRLSAVAHGAGRFVAVGEGGAILHSADGLAWGLAPALTTRELRAVHYAADSFMAVGDQGTVLISRDGIAWENRSGFSANFSGVAYYDGFWWASAPGFLYRAGADLPYWQEVLAPALEASRGLHALDSSVLLARPLASRVQYSLDGRAWHTTSLPESQPGEWATSCLVTGGLVYLGTSEGRVLRTPMRATGESLPQPTAALIAQTAPAGKNVSFTTGPLQPGVTYQWYKDGQPIPGAAGATLDFTPATPADSGRYHVTLTNAAGTTTMAPATLTIDPNTVRLINLSVRARTGGPYGVLTLGFVVAPSQHTHASAADKPLLARAAGPALVPLGVAAAVADPRLQLFADSTELAGNDDWPASLRSTFGAVGAFAFPADSRDAALLTRLAARPYTLQIASAGDAAGEVLAELYDADPEARTPAPDTSDPLRLVNVSARGSVTAGEPLIGGFVLHGAGTRMLLIRAAGPALAGFGVADALASPTVALLADGRIRASNTAWPSAPDPEALRSAAARVGAFPFAAGSRDSALLAPLPAGEYTVQVSAPGGGAGSVLLEVYEVP